MSTHRRSHHRSRHVLAAAAALAVLAFAGEASADAPKYSDLPTGSIAEPPELAKRPAAIGARESVPNLFVVMQKFGPKMGAMNRYVTVVTDKDVAQSIEKGEGFNRDDASICLTEAHPRFDGDDDDEAATPGKQKLTWDDNGTSQVNLWPKTNDNPSAGIGAVHAEKVVESGGAATLESFDAWIDPATKGARLIGKGSVPLKLVGTAIGGTKIYATRTSHGGKPFVDFVIVRSAKGSSAMFGRMGLVAFHHDGNASQSNGCPHLRVSIAVAPNGGDTAVVMVPTELPSLDGKGEEKPTPDAPSDKAKDAPAPPAAPPPPPPPTKARGRKGVSRKPRFVVPPVLGEPKEREIRMRDAQVALSVSQTSRDKEPVLAISYGWAGREQTQRTFEPPAGGIE